MLGSIVAAKDATGKACVFSGAGLKCSSDAAFNGPALSKLKTAAQCTKLANDQKAADAAKLAQFTTQAKALFEKSNPSTAQQQSNKDHVLKGPAATLNSGRHLISNWLKFPDVLKLAQFNDVTGLIALDVSSVKVNELSRSILRLSCTLSIFTP
jgi:hypothetical protein